MFSRNKEKLLFKIINCYKLKMLHSIHLKLIAFSPCYMRQSPSSAKYFHVKLYWTSNWEERQLYSFSNEEGTLSKTTRWTFNQICQTTNLALFSEAPISPKPFPLKYRPAIMYHFPWLFKCFLPKLRALK